MAGLVRHQYPLEKSNIGCSKINNFLKGIINITQPNKSCIFNKTKPDAKVRRTRTSPITLAWSDTAAEKATPCRKSLRKLEKNKIKKFSVITAGGSG